MRVAIVGAPPEVAGDLVALLVERDVELEDIRILGEGEAAGEVVAAGPARLRVELATAEALAGAGIAIFCGDGTLAAKLAETAARSGSSTRRPSRAASQERRSWSPRSTPLSLPQCRPEVARSRRRCRRR